MATKEDQPGLFSKMASFVLGTPKEKAVSVLPEPESDSTVSESAYDKNALKAMIERKRHNDLIRKHEFDALRKLRNNNVSVTTSSARPSVFQASIPSDLDGRADTLKKIDEIEAQMSKQWWKGKQDAAAAKHASSAPVVAPSAPTAPPVRPPAAAEFPHHFDKTVPIEHLVNSTAVVLDSFKSTEAMDVGLSKQLTRSPEYIATQVDANIPPLSMDLDFGQDERSYSISHTHFPSSSEPQIPEISLDFEASMLEFAFEEMVTDPELEEASILYANGDEAAAEQSLLHALSMPGVAENTAKAWVSALLDLFRATNNKPRFDAIAQQFASHLVGSSSIWYVVSTVAGDAPSNGLNFDLNLPPVETAEPEPAIVSDALWESPKELTASALEILKQTLESHAQPWRLGWARLHHITSDAMPLLGVLMRKFCEEPVHLQFIGAERLVHHLAEITPTMESSVAPAWWLVRLNTLRVVQLHDDFENVALDYCVTYEVSPPDWVAAKCQYENVTGIQSSVSAAVPVSKFVDLPVIQPVEAQKRPVVPQGAVELQGEILGDAVDALEAHWQSEGGEAPVFHSGQNIQIYCTHLVRVDFSAAGSILNWAATRQAEGCSVQFRDVNRMVAAFFNVIGIHEHAKVIPPRL